MTRQLGADAAGLAARPGRAGGALIAGLPTPAAPARAGATSRTIRRRTSVRRRLMAAFASVLAAFGAALALQLESSRRSTLVVEAMGQVEVEMRLALDLEAAVRDQFDLTLELPQEPPIDPAAAAAGRERDRLRTASLVAALRDRLGGTALGGAVDRIRDATTELERRYRDAEAGGIDPAALRAGCLPLLGRTDAELDRLFAGLSGQLAGHRARLAEIEAYTLWSTAALLLVVPLLGLLVWRYLRRAVARPVELLGAGAAALAAGRLDTRVALDTGDEFGELGEKFDAMAAQLQGHQARLVEAEKLAGLGRVAAGLAHELNNPLQVMIGYLSLHRDLADRRLADHLAAVEEEARRCQQIVDGMLELSRPQATLRVTPVGLAALCRDVAGRVLATAPHPVHLTVDGDATALADRPKLDQALVNLVRNAVEAAGPGGQVAVRVGEAEGAVEVTVEDGGPGVRPADRPHLFEPFFTTKPAGTGLGLAVTRAIARAHGGEVRVGDRPGGGASFTLRLPQDLERRS